jgi:hypothetical protein
MSRRPSVDLSSLTSEAAAPMPEASQRTPHVVALAAAPSPPPAPPQTADLSAKTPNLQALAFKVPAPFRRRFRQRAADADLKLNELLFEALDAWEQARNLKR